MGVGENIRTFRVLNGMTQEELAQKMGYKSKTTINKIEKEINSMPLDRIQKFAEVLGVPVPVLLGEVSSVSYAIEQTIPYVNQGPSPSEPMSDEVAMIAHIAKGMTEEGVKRLLQYAEEIQKIYGKGEAYAKEEKEV